MKFISFSSLAAALVLSLSAPAHAEIPEAETTNQQGDARERARALFEKGGAAFDAHELEAARAALSESFSIYPSYDTAGLLGQTEIDLGQYRQAATHLDYCLRHFPTGENAELLEHVRVGYSAVQNRVGTLEINVDLNDAEVFIDGERIGKSPLESKIFVDPGTHVVRAVLNWSRQIDQSFSVKKGEARVVRLQFRNDEAATKPSTPEPSQQTARSERNWLPAYVLGGVTLASFVTSMIFRATASSDADEVESLGKKTPGGCSGAAASSSDCKALSDAIDSHDQKATIANVSLVVAGVGAVATAGYVTYTLLQPSDGVPVKATVGFDGAAGRLLVSGHF